MCLLVIFGDDVFCECGGLTHSFSCQTCEVAGGVAFHSSFFRGKGVVVRFLVDLSQPAPWIILLASSQLALVILTTAVTSDLPASISQRCGPSRVLVPGSS